jgi:hypothetical protein
MAKMAMSKGQFQAFKHLLREAVGRVTTDTLSRDLLLAVVAYRSWGSVTQVLGRSSAKTTGAAMYRYERLKALARGDSPEKILAEHPVLMRAKNRAKDGDPLLRFVRATETLVVPELGPTVQVVHDAPTPSAAPHARALIDRDLVDAGQLFAGELARYRETCPAGFRRLVDEYIHEVRRIVQALTPGGET